VKTQKHSTEESPSPQIPVLTKGTTSEELRQACTNQGRADVSGLQPLDIWQ